MKPLACLLWIALPAALLGGCRHQTITPLPNEMPAAGMLVDTQAIPLSWQLELRNYEMLQSPYSNDFYPFNVGSAKRVDRLVSKLYRLDKFVDFVEIVRAEPHNVSNVSPDGQHMLYERPDVHAREGDFPRAYPHDRRTYRVTIYDLRTDLKYHMDCYTEVYGVSTASYWRADSQLAAFTTTCTKNKPFVRQLVVVDACGLTQFDGSKIPDLVGLELIGWAPRGNRLAALRPLQPVTGGATGGTLVMVDLDKQTVTDIAPVPVAKSSLRVYHYEQLIRWDGQNNLSLR
jgi:hypothetical protein